MLIDPTKKPTISKSKYELTLAEFPLFTLSKSKPNKATHIMYEDTITGSGGALIKRLWKVYPHPELGFGTESTLTTLFDLFQVWKEQDFTSQFINFGSVYSLLKRRGVKAQGQLQYNQIVRDLNCLVGMTIEAKNAFWDNEHQAYVDATFHLFDSVYLYKETSRGQASLPFATIKASDELYGSIQKNSILIANFDSDFFHKLTPIEQKIALYLSKMFRSQAVHRKPLLQFAKQIPISAEKIIHIRETIKKACNGLISKGFTILESFSFDKGADHKTDFVIFKRKPGVMPQFLRSGNAAGENDREEIELLVQDIMAICEDEKSESFYRKVARAMDPNDIYRTIAEVKEIRDTGTVHKTKGAIFTSLIKKYAQERGIDL